MRASLAAMLFLLLPSLAFALALPQPFHGGSCPHGYGRSGSFCVPRAGARTRSRCRQMALARTSGPAAAHTVCAAAAGAEPSAPDRPTSRLAAPHFGERPAIDAQSISRLLILHIFSARQLRDKGRDCGYTLIRCPSGCVAYERSAAQYRQLAVDYRRLAAILTKPADKQALELLAIGWDRAAENREAMLQNSGSKS
jgi:hypothetical protein